MRCASMTSGSFTVPMHICPFSNMFQYGALYSFVFRSGRLFSARAKTYSVRPWVSISNGGCGIALPLSF